MKTGKKPKLLKINSASEAMIAILSAVQFMGWNLAVPKLGDDDSVPGYIVGTEEYVDTLSRDADLGAACRKYFTSGNEIPVEHATILRKDIAEYL